MSSFRTGALLALVSPCCLAADPSVTHTFFPGHPAFGDQLYLLHPSGCDDTLVPESDPTLSRHVMLDGTIQWRLSYEVGPSTCDISAPNGTVYAFPLPDEAGMVPGDVVVLDLVDTENNHATTVWHLPVPERVGIPPSVAGTWFNPEHAQQGLMLGYDENAAIAVSWNSYAADGTPRWLTGIAPAPLDASGLNIALNAIESGTFASSGATPADVESWGEIELNYMGCGEMVLHWTPDPATGLASGSAPLRQLTGSFGESCDLEAWVQRRGAVLTTLEPELLESDARQ